MDQQHVRIVMTVARGLDDGSCKVGVALLAVFADRLDMMNHPGVDEFVFFDARRPASRTARSAFDRGIEDIMQASAIIPGVRRSRLAGLPSEHAGGVRALRPRRPNVSAGVPGRESMRVVARYASALSSISTGNLVAPSASRSSHR